MYFNEAIQQAQAMGYTERKDSSKLKDGVYPFSVMGSFSTSGEDLCMIVDAEGTVVSTLKEPYSFT